MAYTRVIERVFRAWGNTAEQFVGGLRVVAGDAVEIAGTAIDAGLVLSADWGGNIITALPEVFPQGAEVPLLAGGVAELATDFLASTAESTVQYILELSGDTFLYVVSVGQWVADGVTDILRPRIGPSDIVTPYPGGSDYQGDEWPPPPIMPSDYVWVDIMQQNGYQAWANASWAFLSWSEYPESQALVAWDLSGGFQIDPISSWSAIEGCEPVVSAENTLDSLGITWRLEIQSGVKYLQAWARLPYPTQPPAGFFRPRNGFGHPGASGLQAMCAGLYVLFGSRVKEDG
jgi:hypothetical protein